MGQRVASRLARTPSNAVCRFESRAKGTCFCFGFFFRYVAFSGARRHGVFLGASVSSLLYRLMVSVKQGNGNAISALSKYMAELSAPRHRTDIMHVTDWSAPLIIYPIQLPRWVHFPRTLSNRARWYVFLVPSPVARWVHFPRTPSNGASWYVFHVPSPVAEMGTFPTYPIQPSLLVRFLCTHSSCRDGYISHVPYPTEPAGTFSMYPVQPRGVALN